MYDATEIDEILALRTMTLTDDEKSAARATDTTRRSDHRARRQPAGRSPRTFARRGPLLAQVGAENGKPNGCRAVVESRRRRIGGAGYATRRDRRNCRGKGQPRAIEPGIDAAPMLRTCSWRASRDGRSRFSDVDDKNIVPSRWLTIPQRSCSAGMADIFISPRRNGTVECSADDLYPDAKQPV